MLFDSTNEINKLCAEGMEMEGKGDMAASLELFTRAWNRAANDAEKSIAAHYLARRQGSVEEKLHWDQVALAHAHKVTDPGIIATYPSLYLNIAKGFKDIGERQLALAHYNEALKYTDALTDDGYSNMIRKGIESGIMRVSGSTI